MAVNAGEHVGLQHKAPQNLCAPGGDNSSAAFLNEAVKLKLQQENLDKACCIAIRNMKCIDRQTALDIMSTYKDKEQARSKEREDLNSLILTIIKNLKQHKEDIKTDEKLRKLDIDIYRKSLLDLQGKIKTVNETSSKRLQKLSEDEKVLSKEITQLASRFDEWVEPVNPSILKPAVKSVSKMYITNTDNTREEVLQFNKFLQENGGHTGGWADEDHLLFLRLRNKSKGKMTFLSLLRQHLPDISADEMLRHEEWYQQYDNLKLKQKLAIEEWKACKQSKSKGEGTISEIGELQPRKEESKEDIEKKKQKILEWKKTLQLKKELENRKQWEEKQKEFEREQKRKEKQELKKAEVERYKEEKLNEQHMKMVEKQMKELQELEERAAQANILLKAFQKQDELFVARRMCRKEERKLKEEQRLKHEQIIKQKVDASRDPSRLLQTTSAWREHCRQNRLRKSSGVVVPMPQLHLRNMPHLQVPNWRKGVK